MNWKNTIPLILLSGTLLCGLSSCQQPEESAEDVAVDVSVIPKPVSLVPLPGVCRLKNIAVSAPEEASGEAAYLIALLRNATSAEVIQAEYGNRQAQILLEFDDTISHAEGYVLQVMPDAVSIRGRTTTGIFYGIQTLRQMLPLPGDSTGMLLFPCLTITDAPRFGYRGMHLDVSRHFWSTDVVKRYLDMMARYKLNHFHWHLTDDQGWRMPINSYPKLNTISSWRDETLIGHYGDQPWQYDGRRYGGFYTRDEIRDIIAFATTRHITVIPEIEMPGHSQAILAAYPEFGCTGDSVRVRKVWGISDDVLCPKEETFAFIESVLTEVIDLFPSGYIHIGGDECPKTQWEQSDFCQALMQREDLQDEMELQSWFIRRVEKFLRAHDRIMIGWDEILEGGLAPNAVVMSWRGTEGGIAAAKQGHDVIMTPTSHVYLDYYQSTSPGEPLAIGGYLPLSKVYQYDPLPEELTPEEQKHILGAQANVWTEYIDTPEKLEYMAWPRGMALAELVWTPKEQKDFTDFAQRLERHLESLHADGISAANHLYDLEYFTSVDSGHVFIGFNKILPALVVQYSVDEGATWQRAGDRIRIDSTTTLLARTETRAAQREDTLRVHIMKHMGAGKQIVLGTPPDPAYPGGGPGSLVNGILGSDNRYGDKEWLGFEGKDLSAVIDLEEVKQIRRVTMRFYNQPESWIYLPERVLLLVCLDGKPFRQVAEISHRPDTEGPIEYQFNLDPIEVRRVKILGLNIQKIPQDKPGAGHDAWLFADEIVVE